MGPTPQPPLEQSDDDRRHVCPGPRCRRQPRLLRPCRPLLEAAGHPAAAVDLPNWTGATLTDQADAIVAAGRGAAEVVRVAQSMGGFSAPLACDRLPVVRLVLVNATIPTSGETAGAWWQNVGQPEAVREAEARAGRDPDAPFDPMMVFLHDLPPNLVERLSHALSPPEALTERLLRP